jgi:chemotaxis protein CheZ
MIPILKVREIISMPSVTNLPQLPSYVEGVTNLRDSIIPIISLKALLNSMDEHGANNTVIVISAGKMTFGVIVDGITGVITVEETSIEPPEKFINEKVDQIQGVAKLGERLIILLDSQKILPVDDLTLLEDAIVDVTESEDGSTVEVVREVDSIGGKVMVKELHDARDFFDGKIAKDDPRHKVFNLMLEFMEALSTHQYEKVDSIVQQLMKETDSDIFQEVGKITRKLHDSIEDFKTAVDSGLDKLTKDDVPNAVDKLQFVISKTEDAANKTMGIVERYFEEGDDFSSHLDKIEGPEDSLNYLKTFKDSLDNDMTSILTAQQFQDVTGQTIKKVIYLVNNVEMELLRLITNFGMPLAPGSIIAENKTDFVDPGNGEIKNDPIEKITQSDVESLLNEFGF